jgi:hypothetical protein
VDCGFLQSGEDFWISDLFPNRKRRGLGPRLVDDGRRQSMVDHGQGLNGRSLEDNQNDATVSRTSPRLRKKGGGDGGDPHRL